MMRAYISIFMIANVKQSRFKWYLKVPFIIEFLWQACLRSSSNNLYEYADQLYDFIVT